MKTGNIFYFNFIQSLKYLWRHKNKNGLEDLKKARWYLDRYIFMQTEDDRVIRAEVERICSRKENDEDGAL